MPTDRSTWRGRTPAPPRSWPFAVSGLLPRRTSSAARTAAERFPLVLPVATAAVAGVSLASARGDLAGVLLATEPVRATGLLGVGGCPGIFNWRAMEADALIGLGRLDDAEAAVDEFEAAIPELGWHRRPWRSPAAGAIWPWRLGNATERTRQFARAHSMEAEVPMPFEQRLLALDDGRRLRAGNAEPAAVAQLEKAHHLFSDLGADPYVQACATELAALRSAAAPDSPATLLGLSRAELAVARLVATGLTNKEVASELYVSVKTVEYHLRNIYIKLDITSRRALAALVN